MSNEEVHRLVPDLERPAGVSESEWIANLSEPARYGGFAPDASRIAVVDASSENPLFKFREILVETNQIDWVDKTLDGLSHKSLWRNEDTGASIALVRFLKGSGIPERHSHASNQFMFCLSGRYRYLPTGIVLTAGSFYWNPSGSLHGPTLAEEDSVLFEVYDGPHYPTHPSWYHSASDTI